MRILVRHIPNTYNYGSLMMAITAIDYLNRYLEHAEFFVDCRTQEDLNRLRQETKLDNIQMAYEHDIVSNSVFSKIVKRFRIAKKQGELYDVKIVLGGDDISEYYGQRGWIIKFPLMIIEGFFVPTILLGQTIGPFTSYRKLLARLALNRTRIYTRDDETLRYIRRLGIKTGSKGRDLAFLQLPSQEAARSILIQHDLNENSYVTVVPSGLAKSYTSNYDDYLDEQLNIIRKLLSNESLKDKAIVLLAHVKAPGTADRTVIEDLEARLGEEERARIIVIKEDILASEARAVLGNGLFTITGRMHAAISTFYMRKPAISLSYSVKYNGVIGKGLGMPDLVIESADDSLWATGQISQLVGEKVEYVLENYQTLVDEIDRNVALTTEMVQEQLDNVVKDLQTIRVSD